MKYFLTCILFLMSLFPALAQDLPQRSESKTKRSTVIDWPEGKMPAVPEGFEVQRFADDLDHPRSLYILPNGDVLTAQARTKLAGFIGTSRIISSCYATRTRTALPM
jgi:glucose/arabinose dehydrogenase